MLNGICSGFCIGFTKPQSSLKAATSNLEGAREHPDVVTDYLSTEVFLGHVAGPFLLQAVSQVHISRFRVIPKGHTGKWRLNVDLSHSRSHSVNDGIPKSLCSLKYITIDEAIKGILQLRQGALLAKIDIKSAFRLLPVHPADRHMLGMQWKDGVYIDTCLPFGLRSSPKLFNILSEFLAWIVKENNVFLNQARAWFLKIVSVRMSVCVCVCVCPPLRLLITSGVMWHDMDPMRLVKQVLQLLYGNCSSYG